MITENLIKELEELSSRSELPLERRLVDTAIWFHRNRDRIPRENLPKRLDFLEKTLDIFLELTALTVDRVQQAEGRPKSRSLWLPSGVSVEGDVRRFG